MRAGKAWMMGALLAAAAGAACPAGARELKCTPPVQLRAKLAGGPKVEVLNELGVWFADHEQYDCAARAFATSLQRAPQQPPFRRVIFMFGASLYFAGDTKEAAEALEEAERAGYRDGKLYPMLGAALDAEHETEKAVEQWRMALDFDPESEVALDALSHDLMDLSRYKDVVALLKQRRLRALRSEQQVAILGAAYMQLGRPEKAARVLENGLNTYPASKAIAGELAEVLTTLHRDAEAERVRQLGEEMPSIDSQTGR